MRVGLFIPCYIDQLYPDVGLATVELLERYDLRLEFPNEQTCCGQPMANSGCTKEAAPLARRFFEMFRPYDAVVCPSGSCVSMVRNHYDEYFGNEPDFRPFSQRVYELCEFLTDVLEVQQLEGEFPHAVGLHQSCHGLRELRLASCSERRDPSYSKPARLLQMLDGVKLVQLQRPDECCGFGGTFAVNEEAVSCAMGLDRLQDHERAGTEVLTAADMSCLMHLGGLIKRQQKRIHVMHIAQILAGRTLKV